VQAGAAGVFAVGVVQPPVMAVDVDHRAGVHDAVQGVPAGVVDPVRGVCGEGVVGGGEPGDRVADVAVDAG